MITILKGDVYMGTAAPASGGGSTVIDSLNVTPTTSAQTITAPTGTDGYSPVNVSAVTASIDSNITAANIVSGVSILGVNGSATVLNGDTLSVTPTTSAQTLTPTSPKNGFTEVSVSAVTSSIDANITASNIKKDVQILGVTGSYEGSGGSGIGITREVSAQGVYQIPALSFTFSLPSNATDIGTNAFYYAFQGCTGLTSVDLSSLTTVSGQYAFQNAFQGCTSLTSVDLSSLATVSGNIAFYYAFEGCTSLTSVDLSSLATVSGQYAFQYAFRSCNQLRTMSFPKLEYIAENGFQLAFYSSGLRSISFGGLKASTMGNVTHPFGNASHIYTFNSCSSLTEIHFRADAKAKIQSLTGYADKWGATNATIYFDIAAAVITFDITPAVGNTIYLSGELVSGTTVYTDLENKTAVISNSSYPLVVKHYTNLQPEQVITTTVDLTQASTSNYIEIQPSESGCTVKFYIDGVEYNPTSVVGDNSRLTLDVDSSVSVGYKVTKSGYQDATGTITFNNAIVTQSVTMQISTSRTVTLQYPFTTDKSYLEHMITDSSEGWNNGYRIGVDEDYSYNYEALVDNNLWDRTSNPNNFGYITFTTGDEPSTLTINANGKFWSGYSGVYISTVSQQRAYSLSDFHDPQFGDGGHWMFYHLNSSFQAQDHTETLQANTTYYISFNHIIEYEGSYEDKPGFQINKIQFDVAV